MAFPAAATFAIASNPTSADFAVAQEAFLAATRQLPGAAARTELTIASGTILPTAASHTVDTESNAATDDLANIQQTNTPDGFVLILWPENTGRVVTLKHLAGGTGQISLLAEVDLAHTIPVILQRIGSLWKELFHGEGAGGHTAIEALLDIIGWWVVRHAGGSVTDNYTGAFAGGLGAYSGLLVTETTPPTMKVTVAVGLYAIANVPCGMTVATESAVMSAPISNPRIDTISLTAAGAITVTGGAEAANPVAPATPAGQFPLATVYHRVGAVHIHTTDDTTNSYVYSDERYFFN